MSETVTEETRIAIEENAIKEEREQQAIAETAENANENAWDAKLAVEILRSDFETFKSEMVTQITTLNETVIAIAEPVEIVEETTETENNNLQEPAKATEPEIHKGRNWA